MALLNYTTGIDAAKTVSEIQAILASKGARSIMVEYGDGGVPVAVAFEILVSGHVLRYKLPCNVERVRDTLHKQWRAGKVEKRHTTDEHARRVAWRIVKTWVEAQMAVVESGIVDLAEVFLPYQLLDDGRTTYQAVKERFLLLPGGDK